MLLSRKERSISLDFLPGWPKPPRPYTGPPRGVRGAYFAALRDHLGRALSDEERYAYGAAVLGRSTPIKGTREWTPAMWSFFLDAFSRHCEHCPGGERCTALVRAREMVGEGVVV